MIFQSKMEESLPLLCGILPETKGKPAARRRLWRGWAVGLQLEDARLSGNPVPTPSLANPQMNPLFLGTFVTYSFPGVGTLLGIGSTSSRKITRNQEIYDRALSSEIDCLIVVSGSMPGSTIHDCAEYFSRINETQGSSSRR